MSDVGALHLFRVVHILAGIVWTGWAIFVALLLMPSLKVLGPAAGVLMDQMTRVRRMPIWFMAATILTILSGVYLYWRDSLGFQAEWMRSGPGIVFGVGGVIAIVTAIIGMSVNAPAAGRLAALGAAIQASGGPPTPEQAAEMARLQDRLQNATRLVSVLLTITAATMAVARYVP